MVVYNLGIIYFDHFINDVIKKSEEKYVPQFCFPRNLRNSRKLNPQNAKKIDPFSFSVLEKIHTAGK